MTKEQILEKLRFDMEIRNRTESTKFHYLRHVRLFQDYYNKPADEMGEAEISSYLHYLLTERKLSAASVNTYNSSLRFLYAVTLNTSLNIRHLPRVRSVRSLPVLPDKAELQRIFEAAPNFRYKTLFMTIYGSGLRGSEAVNLKVSDIDSKSMRIFIRKGKGGRDRYALLPEKTLLTLREYYKQYRPKDWLFGS